MLQASCLLFAFVTAIAPASEDGAAWVGKAESRLYRWQKPGSIVRFDVKTDVLDAPIATMEHDLIKSPDREGTRLVEALKRVVVHGAVDTGSGAVETEIVIDCDTKDAKVKANIEKMKSMLGDLVRGAFEGLPLHDPSLVTKGSSIVGAEIQGDTVRVTLGGKHPGDESTLTIDRRTTLPTNMVMPWARLDYAYTEVAPGHFAPTKLDVQPTTGPSRSAEYTWQKLGNTVFPASIHISQGTQTSRLSFESAHVDAHSR